VRVAFLAFGAFLLPIGAAPAAEAPQALSVCAASDLANSGERVIACTDIIGNGPSYDAYLWRAAAYSELGNRAAAIADLTAAIELAPDSAAAYSARGTLHLKDDEFRDGLVDLDRALELAPGDEATLRTRAFAWDSLRNYASAIADYGALLALTGDETYRYFRGFAYFHRGDDAAAIVDFDAIVDSNSATLVAWAHRGRGRVYERQGALTAALADYEMALAADPSDDRAFAGRCRVRMALGGQGADFPGCAGAIRGAAGSF
jgi:tetratricopeptide (TPR) repeat protein